jgi:tetratricopeptide (TPR) repeat protein
MHHLAHALANQGKYAEAQKLLEEVLDIRRRVLGPEHPDTLDSILNLAMVSQVDYLPTAKKHYDEVLELDLDKYGNPEISNLYKNRGAISLYLEDYEDAIADFEKALQINSNDVGAHLWLCKALAICPEMERRDEHRAIEMGEASVKLSPTNFHAWVWLGAAHYVAGDYDAAISALNKGFEVSPDTRDPRAGFYLAMIHWRSDQKQEAVEWYDKATNWVSLKGPAYQAEIGRIRDQAVELLGLKRGDEDQETTEEESAKDEEQSTESEN